MSDRRRKIREPKPTVVEKWLSRLPAWRRSTGRLEEEAAEHLADLKRGGWVTEQRLRQGARAAAKAIDAIHSQGVGLHPYPLKTREEG